MLRFIKKYSWIIFLAFLLLLFPQSLSDQAKLNMRVIITGVGLDYVDGQYQVTSQIVLPQNGTESGGISAHISYLSATADTISDGIQRVSYKLGKLAELSHMEFILVGESMKDHNLASALDYFYRNFKLKNSVMLIACLGSAKDAIFKTKELELGVALSLQKIYISNESSLNGVETSYVDFISDSYSTSGCSVLDTFVISTAQEEASQGESSSSGQSAQGSESSNGGGSQGGSEQSSGSSNSSSASESAKMRTKTPIILFKNGKFAGKIENKEQVLGYYFTNKKSKTGNIFLNNFSFGDIQNANINLRIDNMKKSYSIAYENNKIVHTINIDITDVKIDEIAPYNSSNLLQYKQLPKSTQDQILKEASQKIKTLVNSTFLCCQEQNFDIFKTADLCYKTNPIKWQEFLNGLINPSDYINNVSVVVKVNFSRLT